MGGGEETDDHGGNDDSVKVFHAPILPLACGGEQSPRKKFPKI
jgi:hypothetical protein